MVKCIIAVMDDGARTLLHTVPMEFDTQAWANARVDSFNLLKISKIEEQIVVFSQQNNNPTLA
jgi:hypothetical protein